MPGTDTFWMDCADAVAAPPARDTNATNARRAVVFMGLF
jgi:hypothetical protein